MLMSNLRNWLTVINDFSVDTKDEETKDETASGNIDQFFNNSTEKSSCTLNNQFCSKDSEKVEFPMSLDGFNF